MRHLEGPEWTLDPGKRAVDLVGMAALAPVFIPAGLIIATAISHVDNMNPVFEQTRYGLDLEPFTFYKFRTMPEDTPETPSKGRQDSRRTGLGTTLSEYHLDEMLNGVNIVNGTMSLVGGRPTIWQDVERTLDILSPSEQKQWRAAKRTAKPGVFGEFQNDRSVDNQAGTEAFMRARAMHDIHYAATASFKNDNTLIFQTALTALNIVRGKDNGERLHGTTGAHMLQVVAEGHGVTVSDEQHEYWRASLLAARKIDDLVDKDGVRDVQPYVAELLAGKTITGMNQAESIAFEAMYWQQPRAVREQLLGTFMALPYFAERKRTATSAGELLEVNLSEATLFANMLELPVNGRGAATFNGWLHKFAKAGYLADMVLDAERDHSSGLIGVRLSGVEKFSLAAQALGYSANTLTQSPVRSLFPLGRAALTTLLTK